MRIGFLLVLTLGACAGWHAPQREAVAPPQPEVSAAPAPGEQVGKASIYSKSLTGQPMANGKPFDPTADVVASKTLPLGTVAKVTNLETGKSAVVRVEDRGSLPKGRIVDLAPATAGKIGLSEKQGVAKVAVQPITAPAQIAQP